MNYLVYKKIIETPYALKYLRENSYWYKKLNRNPELLDKMIDEMKEKYELKFSNKVEKIINTVDLVTKIFNN
jgi:hypothetical protein